MCIKKVLTSTSLGLTSSDKVKLDGEIKSQISRAFYEISSSMTSSKCEIKSIKAYRLLDARENCNFRDPCT